jgi:hypothetical protein
MSTAMLRIASHERMLCNIGTIFCNDLVLYPVQCKLAKKRLLALRRATQAAHMLYSTLDPEDMRRIAPTGVLVKLHYLDDEVTELLLLLDALAPIITEPTYARVQLQLLIRHLCRAVLITFDEATAQLAALVEKEAGI